MHGITNLNVQRGENNLLYIQLSENKDGVIHRAESVHFFYADLRFRK